MAVRMIARGRHLSTGLILWSAALLLGIADLLAAAGLQDGHRRTAAFLVAAVAGFLLGTALLRGVGSLVARVRIRQALSAHREAGAAADAGAVHADAVHADAGAVHAGAVHADAVHADAVHAEAARGIAQIEAFLAEHHPHGA